MLEELNRDAMEIVEEQHDRLKETRLNLTTPVTSEAKASEPDNYGGARPKTTSRANITFIVPGMLPEEAMVCDYKTYSKLRQGWLLEECAALLRDEVFSVIFGTMKIQNDTVSKSRKVKSGSELSEDEVFESYHLPQVPDTPITGSGHGHKVTFRSPIVRPGSVSSTPHLVPQPVCFDLSRIPDIETSWKDMDSKAEGRQVTPHHKAKRMRNCASITSHSHQLVAEELRKICEPKIQKHKGGYSVNAMLVLNSWLKDVKMCVKE